jgi:hypothetical protein
MEFGDVYHREVLLCVAEQVCLCLPMLSFTTPDSNND